MPHLQHQLLLKLAINSAINPLTAILGLGSLPNGALTACAPGYSLTSALTDEASTILTAYIHSLHAPRPAPAEVVRLFSHDSLVQRTSTVIRQTASNRSSMASDIAAGNLAEVNEINGYLASLASRLGVPAPLNRMMVDMVKFVSALSATYPSKSVPAQYRIALKDTKSALKSDADVAMQERKLALEERKMDLEERMIRVKEDEALDRVQARRRRKRAGEATRNKEGKSWYEAKVERQMDRGVTEQELLDRSERRQRIKQGSDKRAARRSGGSEPQDEG
jgi:2-dehydropantoate 2-reductase